MFGLRRLLLDYSVIKTTSGTTGLLPINYCQTFHIVFVGFLDDAWNALSLNIRRPSR
jgi:hypothetical protein